MVFGFRFLVQLYTPFLIEKKISIRHGGVAADFELFKRLPPGRAALIRTKDTR